MNTKNSSNLGQSESYGEKGDDGGPCLKIEDPDLGRLTQRG